MTKLSLLCVAFLAYSLTLAGQSQAAAPTTQPGKIVAKMSSGHLMVNGGRDKKEISCNGTIFESDDSEVIEIRYSFEKASHPCLDGAGIAPVVKEIATCVQYDLDGIDAVANNTRSYDQHFSVSTKDGVTTLVATFTLKLAAADSRKYTDVLSDALDCALRIVRTIEQ